MEKRLLTVFYHGFALAGLLLTLGTAVFNMSRSEEPTIRSLLALFIGIGMFTGSQYLARQVDKQDIESLKEGFATARGVLESSDIRSYKQLAYAALRCEHVILGSLSMKLDRPDDEAWPAAKLEMAKNTGIKFTYICAMQDEDRVNLIKPVLEDYAEGKLVYKWTNTHIVLLPVEMHHGDFMNVVILDNKVAYLVLPNNYGDPSKWLMTRNADAIEHLIAFLKRFEDEASRSQAVPSLAKGSVVPEHKKRIVDS